jgi:hypothetical protein
LEDCKCRPSTSGQNTRRSNTFQHQRLPPPETYEAAQLVFGVGGIFCDLGTSLYYVPGSLYGNVRDKTPFLILLTTLGFIPLALKYIEIT